MRKVEQTDLYARIRELPISDADREAAIHALRQSEAIAEAIIWVKNKVAEVGTFFLRPSLKR